MNPAAGVTATRPTTMPVAAPTAVGFRRHVVEDRPDDQRAGRREHVVAKASAGGLAGGERAAGIEPEPAEPEQAGAEQHERHVVRQQRRLLEVAPLADDDRRDQRRDAGIHVHHGAAGEVERAHVGQPAAAPHPVRDRA